MSEVLHNAGASLLSEVINFLLIMLLGIVIRYIPVLIRDVRALLDARARAFMANLSAENRFLAEQLIVTVIRWVEKSPELAELNLQGREKLDKALEEAEVLFDRYRLPFNAREVEQWIEAALQQGLELPYARSEAVSGTINWPEIEVEVEDEPATTQ